MYSSGDCKASIYIKQYNCLSFFLVEHWYQQLMFFPFACVVKIFFEHEMIVRVSVCSTSKGNWILPENAISLSFIHKLLIL